MNNGGDLVDWGQTTALLLERIRSQRPLVHVITNMVAANHTANALIQTGARPVMAEAPEETAEVTLQADALVLNLGIPTGSKLDAMTLSGIAANHKQIPIILDPVGVAVSQYRAAALNTLLREMQVDIIKGNSAEIGWVAGIAMPGSGVDAVARHQDDYRLGQTCAKRLSAVTVVTGRDDLITDGLRCLQVKHGHPWLAQISGSGCMAGGVIGAFAAVTKDPLIAAVCAMIYFGLAGELAAQDCPGPGSYPGRIIDMLYHLDPTCHPIRIDEMI
jgi:hydroxyethylthiazole kinase